MKVVHGKLHPPLQLGLLVPSQQKLLVDLDGLN